MVKNLPEIWETWVWSLGQKDPLKKGMAGGAVVERTCLPVQETQELWVLSWARKISLEKEMATYSSILAWRIPWREEPGELQSRGSQRVGHD